MARVRVKINRDAIRELMASEPMQNIVTEKAEAVADACNAQSSWGGYAFAPQKEGADDVRARARVWSYARQDRRGQTERVKRMIRNLDAE